MTREGALIVIVAVTVLLIAIGVWAWTKRRRRDATPLISAGEVPAGSATVVPRASAEATTAYSTSTPIWSSRTAIATATATAVGSTADSPSATPASRAPSDPGMTNAITPAT